MDEEDYIFVEIGSSDTELLSGGTEYVALVNLSTCSSIGVDESSALSIVCVHACPLMNASAAIVDTGSRPRRHCSHLCYLSEQMSEPLYSDSSDNFGFVNLTNDRSIASSSLTSGSTATQGASTA